MTNEEMFTAIIERMDSMESGLTGLTGRIDKVESGLTGLIGRIDNLESDMKMEFWAVRTEMDVVNKSLKKDISVLNDKVDRLMYIQDVDGYEKMRIQVDLLASGRNTTESSGSAVFPDLDTLCQAVNRNEIYKYLN